MASTPAFADRAIQIRRDRFARTRRADAGRRGAGSRPHRHDRGGGPDHSRRPKSIAPRGIRATPARRRAGRAHPRAEGILGPAAETLGRNPGAAARHRNRRGTGAGDAARGTAPDQPPRIADIGTGSGAILLALLSELPQAHGVGTDISELALQTAHSNAAALGLAGRASFVACDYAAALAGPFDLIVSNPPYIRSADIAGLAREVRDHDPRRGARRRRRRARRLSCADPAGGPAARAKRRAGGRSGARPERRH